MNQSPTPTSLGGSAEPAPQSGADLLTAILGTQPSAEEAARIPADIRRALDGYSIALRALLDAATAGNVRCQQAIADLTEHHNASRVKQTPRP